MGSSCLPFKSWLYSSAREGRAGPRSCQRKQANCTGAWFIIHRVESWEQGLSFLVTFPGLYLWGSLGLVNLVGEKGKLRVLTSQEEMSRFWFSFCKARTQSSPDSGWKKRKKSKKTRELPEGSHLGGKRRRLRGVGEIIGQENGIKERKESLWVRSGTKGGLPRTRRREDVDGRGEGQVGRGLGRGVGHREEGLGRAQAEGAHPGHWSQERSHALHAGSRHHAAPAPPRARVTLPLLPPPGRPSPASVRKTPLGSARVRSGVLRGPVQPQPPEAKPSTNPAASSGPWGVWTGLSRRPPWYWRVGGMTRKSITSRFLACPSQATYTLPLPSGPDPPRKLPFSPAVKASVSGSAWQVHLIT